MLKARFDDGTPVLAKHHISTPGGPKILCADFNCQAEMVFCRAVKALGDRETRQAHFFSKDASAHVAGCTAHSEAGTRDRDQRTIRTALEQGGRVIINLNLGLKGAYDAAASKATGKSSIEGQRPEDAAVSAKNIEDIFDYLAVIEDKAGSGGLWSRTIVNHGGKTASLSDFIVDTPDKYLHLLGDLKAKTSSANFPRLMYFRPTEKTHAGINSWLQGTPVDYLTAPGGRAIVLLERAYVPPKFEKALRAEPLNIVAIPKIDENEIENVETSFRLGNKKKEFIHINWQIHGAHQFSPAETLPVPPKQANLQTSPKK